MNKRIWKIVITGGPCAGKTTGMSYVRQKLEDLGFLVLIVPEVATLLINGGINPGGRFLDGEIFQITTARTILALEDNFCAIARGIADRSESHYKGAVILYDRGLMDGKAYCQQFEEVLRAVSLSVTQARDERYDAVLHLVTAASGAESFYTLENNRARSEGLIQAQVIDQLTQQAWVGSEHLRIIDNSTDFNGKLRRLLAEIYSVIGIPVPIEHERKFLVRSPFIPANTQAIEISQTYITGGDRLRKRGQGGSFCYYVTHKRSLDGEPAKRIETQRQVSVQEYQSLLAAKELETVVIEKTRNCFLYSGQYFELDSFIDPRAIDPGCYLLEIELTGEKTEVEIPTFVEVVREVTGEEAYTNYVISKRLFSSADDVPF